MKNLAEWYVNCYDCEDKNYNFAGNPNILATISFGPFKISTALAVWLNIRKIDTPFFKTNKGEYVYINSAIISKDARTTNTIGLQ